MWIIKRGLKYGCIYCHVNISKYNPVNDESYCGMKFYQHSKWSHYCSWGRQPGRFQCIHIPDSWNRLIGNLNMVFYCVSLIRIKWKVSYYSITYCEHYVKYVNLSALVVVFSIFYFSKYAIPSLILNWLL